MFHDPLAEKLAGELGRRIAAKLSHPGSLGNGWPIIARTAIIDDYVRCSVADGCTSVLNLAAGMDTRPYRLELPPELDWIEVDLPAIIQFKEETLVGERPVCRLRRQAVDLADGAARSRLFDEVSASAAKVLVISEGLLIYLDPARRGSVLHQCPTCDPRMTALMPTGQLLGYIVAVLPMACLDAGSHPSGDVAGGGAPGVSDGGAASERVSGVVQEIDLDQVWSGHPVGFSLFSSPPWQFAAYYDSDRHMTVAQRRLHGLTWEKTTLPSTLGWDSHNRVVLAVDPLGFVHVSGNMHNVPLVYFRSTQPFDVHSIERVEEMVGRDEYPDRVQFRFHDTGGGSSHETRAIPGHRVGRRQRRWSLRHRHEHGRCLRHRCER